MTFASEIAEARHAALDGFRGEPVRIEPRMTPPGPRSVSGPDPARPVREIVGRYRSKPITAELEGNREGSRFQSMTRIAGNAITMRISPPQAATLGYALAANDRIVLLARPGAPTFTIARVGARDGGELMLELTTEAAA